MSGQRPMLSPFWGIVLLEVGKAAISKPRIVQRWISNADCSHSLKGFMEMRLTGGPFTSTLMHQVPCWTTGGEYYGSSKIERIRHTHGQKTYRY